MRNTDIAAYKMTGKKVGTPTWVQSIEIKPDRVLKPIRISHQADASYQAMLDLHRTTLMLDEQYGNPHGLHPIRESPLSSLKNVASKDFTDQLSLQTPLSNRTPSNMQEIAEQGQLNGSMMRRFFPK